jgi:hypothetical protein
MRRLISKRQSTQEAEMLEGGKCSQSNRMKTVFGDKSNWPKAPNSITKAKEIQLSTCNSSTASYGEYFCIDLIRHHFKTLAETAPDADESKDFETFMTGKFCSESRKLYKIDKKHTNYVSLLAMTEDKELQEKSSLQSTGECFPNRAEVTVQLQDGTVSKLSMAQLQIGDMVYTGNEFSRLVFFMDRDPDATKEYVQLRTEAGFELSLTPDHILFAYAEKIPIQAENIVKGDLLWVQADIAADLVSTRVTDVVRTVDHGKHAPVTEHGVMVVNGVLTSCYSAIANLLWDGKMLVSGHDLCKYLHKPLEAACSLWSSFCGPEWHNRDGYHVWTALLLSKLEQLHAWHQSHSDLKENLWTQLSMYSFIMGLGQMAMLVYCSMFGGGVRSLVVVGSTLVAVHLSYRHGAAQKEDASSESRRESPQKNVIPPC